MRLLPSHVPQFSSFDHGTIKLVNVLHWHAVNGGLGFAELGQLLLHLDRSDVALRKYGENHAKLGEMLGLVSISSTHPRIVCLAEQGARLRLADTAERATILGDAIASTVIITALRDLLRIQKGVRIQDYLEQNGLAKSTARRRAPNVRCLIRKLEEYAHPLAIPLREGVQ